MQEAKHFVLANKRLNELGFKYGDFPVHDEIWLTALKTRKNILRRLAYLHCTIEARGIDVTVNNLIPRCR